MKYRIREHPEHIFTVEVFYKDRDWVKCMEYCGTVSYGTCPRFVTIADARNEIIKIRACESREKIDRVVYEE